MCVCVGGGGGGGGDVVGEGESLYETGMITKRQT